MLILYFKLKRKVDNTLASKESGKGSEYVI